MPREVIHVQVGQCGNQIGTKFWETIAQEHGLAPDGTYCGNNPVQLEKVDVYFHETSTGQFVPRGVLTDCENSVLNHITSRTYGKMFRPENFLSTSEGAGNNFMNGCYHDDSAELCAKVIDVLRKEVERTKCCQGFTFSHSAAGGSGSGLAMQIFSKSQQLLVPSFGGCWFFTIFPSAKISNTCTEPYNTILTLEKLTLAENVVCIDNESLYNICFDTLGLDTPTFGDLNRLVSMCMSGNTAPFRFPGQLNTDLNKLSYSLRVRPFLHYYVPSFAPLTALKNQPYRQLTVSELVRQMTAQENMFIDYEPSKDEASKAQSSKTDIWGRTFSYAALFRGGMTSSQVDDALVFLRGDMDMETKLRRTIGLLPRDNLILDPIDKDQLFIAKNPRPAFNTITGYAPPGMPMSATYLNNTSAIKFKFLKILQEAMKMYALGAYAHWYDPSNFASAQGSLTSLDECFGKMCDEWISEFGTEDMSNYPEPQNEETICKMMMG